MPPPPDYPVRPIFTGDDWMTPEPRLHGVRASSATAAIRACRDAGYRVMIAGGCIELTGDDYSPDGVEWKVTVHPAR